MRSYGVRAVRITTSRLLCLYDEVHSYTHQYRWPGPLSSCTIWAKKILAGGIGQYKYVLVAHHYVSIPCGVCYNKTPSLFLRPHCARKGGGGRLLYVLYNTAVALIYEYGFTSSMTTLLFSEGHIPDSPRPPVSIGRWIKGKKIVHLMFFVDVQKRAKNYASILAFPCHTSPANDSCLVHLVHSAKM